MEHFSLKNKKFHELCEFKKSKSLLFQETELSYIPGGTFKAPKANKNLL